MTPRSEAGQHRPHLLVVVRREEVDDAVHGLDRVDRVQRAEHEVTGLGGAQGRGDGLLVAHLADQDHVRVLAQHPPQGLRERGRVEADLALVHDRLLVAVQVLDRVLDRDDVARRSVDVVDHGGERGRLAGPGGAGDEDDAAGLVGELADGLRQVELLAFRMSNGTTRQAIEIEPRWRKAFTRKRASPADRVGEVDLPVPRELGQALARGEHLAQHRSVSAGLSASVSSTSVSSPCSRMSGRDGTFR